MRYQRYDWDQRYSAIVYLNNWLMFRKKTSRISQTEAANVRSLTFDEAFWSAYVDSYSKSDYNDKFDAIPCNPKKYHHNSTTVSTIVKYFESLKLPIPSSNQIIALLKSPFTQGDVVKTFHLIRFYELCDVGLFLTNEANDKFGCVIEQLGAENWENVMCYMDALLYSMFANLESFEPMLFISNQHENRYVNQLSALLRVYVSILRSGNLITTDLTTRICEVLLKLGFNEAMSHRQQDSAALFQFLTETLSMPLLTFKIDIKHGGKYDKDDHKYSKERMLFVSIPEQDEQDSNSDAESEIEILLEECLENYFNNSISVKRELERRATLESIKRENNPGGKISFDSTIPENSAGNLQGDESIRLYDPVSANGNRRLRSDSKNGVHQSIRTRSSTLSIWSLNDNEHDSSGSREVNLPAWMFLRLLPFYTDDNEMTMDECSTQSIAKSSKEFVNRRPILPICLKRYSFNNSQAHRSQKRIIIPPIINLPSFVADDQNDKTMGDYSLILESAVCHKGTSIALGHFISVVRKHTDILERTEEEAYNATWLMYDDMKKRSRIVEKSFKEIFETEWPYMLFYRLVANNETNSSDTGSFLSRYENIKPIITPQGAKYQWKDQIDVTPNVKQSNSDEILSSRKQSTLSNTSSIPIPDIAPTDAKFVDIRNKYFWYVPDKDMNYYKELLSHSDNHDNIVSLSPYFRRNSQWSITSNISSINQLPQSNMEVESDTKEITDDLSRTGLASNISSGSSNYWKKRNKPKGDDHSNGNTSNEIKNNVSNKTSLPSEASHQQQHQDHLNSDIEDGLDGTKKSKLFSRSKKKRDEYKKEKCILM